MAETPTLSTEFAELNRCIDQRAALIRTVEAAFQKHARNSDVTQAAQEAHDKAAQVLCAAVDASASQSNENIKVDIGLYAASMVELLLAGTESKARLDKRSITELARRLALRFHPDRDGADPTLFQLSRQAKTTNNLPLLYSMWVKYVRQSETPEYDNMMTTVVDHASGELDRARGVLLPIANAFISGDEVRTVNAIVQALKVVKLRNTQILHS